MQMRARLEALIDEMLDGQIMLDEAVAEFEKLYIQKALARHKEASIATRSPSASPPIASRNALSPARPSGALVNKLNLS